MSEEELKQIAWGYQGKDKQLLDMTREELIVELVNAMDRLEEIDLVSERLRFHIDGWRMGYPVV